MSKTLTEARWLASADPAKMLTFLRGKASKRKELLFAIACCRRVAPLFEGKGLWVLPVAGLFVPQPHELMERTRQLAEQPTSLCFGIYDNVYPGSYADEGHASFAVDAVLYSVNAERASTYAAYAAALAAEGYEDNYSLQTVAPTLPAFAKERAAQAELLRCIVGNPFRPVILDSSWLMWNDGIVGKLARNIDEECSFDCLPFLADALEEAGCDDQHLLGHCRKRGALHASGCFVIDLLLGKGAE